MERKHSTAWLAYTLFRLWLAGWRQVPGYTVCERERSGDIYIAVTLRAPRGTWHDNTGRRRGNADDT